MKKILFIVFALCAALISVATASAENSISRSGVNYVIHKFRNADNFKVSEVGRIDVSSGSGFTGEMAAKIKNLKSIVTVDVTDCTPDVKESFCSEMAKCLEGCGKLAEFNGNGKQVCIYGSKSANGKYVKNAVIIVGGDKLVFLFGKIAVKDFSGLGDMG
ncbi:MAG: hypothetical protein LKI42_04835 [Bacteroidales bacterium]|jgi:hypothetical protein|nr:hypothetical protein [Bacteroidales bacterium]MCI1786160.1 hypothetical protein [Bacteroidales bacterium]